MRLSVSSCSLQGVAERPLPCNYNVDPVCLRPFTAPGNIFTPETAATQRRVALAEGDHALEEAENILIGLELRPIEPSRDVVLVIRIIIAKLRIQEFISGSKHRGSVRQHKQAEEVLHLLPVQRQHLGRGARITLMSAVPAVVLVHSVLVILSVGPIMLLVVGDQIIQSEAVLPSPTQRSEGVWVCDQSQPQADESTMRHRPPRVRI